MTTARWWPLHEEACQRAFEDALGAWVEAQQDWLKGRSLSATSERHAGCLQDAYVGRIAVLEALRLVASRPQRQAGPGRGRGRPPL